MTARPPACLVCYVDKHNQHKCSDINKAADKFKKQMSEDIEAITKCLQERKKKIEQVEADKKKFEDEVSAAEQEISKRYDQLRSLIDSHQRELMEELESIKVKHLKEIEMIKDEDERHLMMMESYKKYSEEMKEKATGCDISRAGDDLHVRAVELIKTQEKHNNQPVNKVTLSFKTAALITVHDVKKLFGTIQTSMPQPAKTFQEQSETVQRGTHSHVAKMCCKEVFLALLL